MFDDSLFEHLEPRSSKRVEHQMAGVSIPKDNQNSVILYLKFCGRGSPFWNAITKLKQLSDPIAATKRVATLFAQHGVSGWSNVLHDGQPVAYSAKLGADVFCKLIDRNRTEKVNAAVDVACDPDNFTDPLVEAEELGKD